MVDVAKYAKMQKDFFEANAGANPEGVVGSYDYHENFPYETNLLYKYGDIRKPVYYNFRHRSAFEYGCGEGRMIRRMRKFFGQVDGVDISESMVNHARARCRGSNIYVTEGMNAGAAKSNAYDFAYCTLSLQQISVHEVRDQIIDDLVRILKPGGKMTLQFLFSKFYPFVHASLPTHVLPPPRTIGQASPEPAKDVGVQTFFLDTKHAGWHDNKDDSGSGCDVVIGTDEIAVVEADMRRKFESVECWFHDISIGRTEPRALSHLHPNSHLGPMYLGTHFMFIHCDRPKK